MKRLTARQYAEVLTASASQAKTGDRSAVVKRFLQLLRRQRATNLLPRIMTELQRIEDGEAGVTRVKIASAMKLDTKHVERVLAEKLGKVVIESTIQPELVAGVTLRVGDELVDGSVRGELQRLHTQLMSSHA